MTLDEGLLFRFSYCTIPPDTVNDSLRTMFADAGMLGKHVDLAWKGIDQFPVVTHYLKLIASAHGLNYRDPVVAESMIFGNELLDMRVDYSGLEMYVFEKTGREVQFPNAPCHHNIHVDVVGFMELMAPTEENKRDCRVIPGRVYGTSMLVLEGTDPRAELEITNPFSYNLHQGDLVATHRRMVIAKITDVQARNIVKYGFELQR